MQDIEKIYNSYAKTVYKYIFCLSKDEELSKEIVQETFEVAIKNINRLKEIVRSQHGFARLQNIYGIKI